MLDPGETVDVADVRVVLASSSPRRRVLLHALGVSFDVDVPDVDEAPLPGEAVVDYVERLAASKVDAVRIRHSDALVIGADTAIELDGAIVSKPDDADHAAAMLRALSNRAHMVHSGVAVHWRGHTVSSVATTVVMFNDLSDDDIAVYVDSGEPLDKAGAYGIQGAGSTFVAGIVGAKSTVVGLPLHLTAQLARDLGVEMSRTGVSSGVDEPADDQRHE